MVISKESMSMCNILCWIHDVCILWLVYDMVVTRNDVLVYLEMS